MHLLILVSIFLAFPAAYFAISYVYLAWWHNNVVLWNTLVHENGRLTLAGSLFYYDHFLACVPMVLVFALCAAGGFAIAGQVPLSTNRSRAALTAGILISLAVAIVLVAFVMSVNTVGRQRTLDYALQKIERDGVMSRGGNWNQLQLSNVPIALGTIGLSSAFVVWGRSCGGKQSTRTVVGGKICLAAAATLLIGISTFNFQSWGSFLNPRWMAHSMRELATYPLTGIPIAVLAVLLVERYLSGVNAWGLKLGSLSLTLIGLGIGIAFGELLLLSNVDVLAIAQKPAFSPGGLSVPYLLCSHVFEHFLDFVLIGPLTGGIYAIVRLLARA